MYPKKEKSWVYKTTALVMLITQFLSFSACAAKSEINSEMKASAQISQTKILQGSDGFVYLQVDLKPPSDTSTYRSKKPTDFMVVLDRSGSMAEAKKMDYAHKALSALLSRMRPQDRVGLVIFDDQVETVFPLTQVTSSSKPRLQQMIQQITPRGSTNLGAGLEQGIYNLTQAQRTFNSNVFPRLILISDGLANQGITDNEILGQMAHSATHGEWSISTIGVGLDFNERLMSTLADQGSGLYHFLENPASMESIVSQEMNLSHDTYATDVELQLNLSPDINIIEASGYPIRREGSKVMVQPGPVYLGQNRTFFVTLQLPSDHLYARPLGEVSLKYLAGDKTQSISLLKEPITIGCVASNQTEEVKKSILQEVYQNAWTQNNYGQMLKQSADRARSGDAPGTLGYIQDYKNKLESAAKLAPSPVMNEKIKALDSLVQQSEAAFQGPDQEAKVKRLTKEYHEDGFSSQRIKK